MGELPGSEIKHLALLIWLHITTRISYQMHVNLMQIPAPIADTIYGTNLKLSNLVHLNIARMYQSTVEIYLF